MAHALIQMHGPAATPARIDSNHLWRAMAYMGAQLEEEEAALGRWQQRLADFQKGELDTPWSESDIRGALWEQKKTVDALRATNHAIKFAVAGSCDHTQYGKAEACPWLINEEVPA